MPVTRTRRAAARKQQQYRIPDSDSDSDEDGVNASKKNCGGILASLNHNIPQVKKNNQTRKAVKSGFSNKADEQSTPPKLQTKGSSTPKKTPPPPSSVVVGSTLPCFSPPTQAYSNGVILDYDHDLYGHMDDGVSAMSCDIASPPLKPRNKAGTRKKDCYVEDEVVDDDKTIPFEGEEEASLDEKSVRVTVNDPNETLLESDDDGDVEEEEELTSEPDFDEGSSESESEEEDDCDDDEDEYEPEDDDYVPDEDDSASEDEFEYIEEEEKPASRRTQKKPIDELLNKEDSPCPSHNISPLEKQKKKPAPRRNKKKPIDELMDRENSPCLSRNETYTSPVVKQKKNRGSVERSPVIQSPLLSPAPTMFSEASVNTPDKVEDDATIIEETPARNILPSLQSMNFSTPEAQVAVVVDDDDDGDDDVLVATILDDDQSFAGMDGTRTGGEVSVHESQEVEDNISEVDNAALFDQSIDSDMEGKDQSSNFQDDQNIQEEEEKEEDSMIHSNIGGELSQNMKSIEDNAHSEPSSVSSFPAAEDTTTTVTKKTQKRKSFFRQEGSVRRGKWALGAKIGTGSFGVVHVGMNTKTGTLMAVKQFKMDGAVMKDIRTEIELMRSLKHRNIVRYLGAQMDKLHFHIFQEWVPGGSVASLLSRFGPFSWQVVKSYISQTLSGLAYLHENDIMHRDIKGSNLLVNDEGVVKLADFGASKKLKNLQDNLMMSLTVRGTPYFMAPEVFEEKYSAKADIWGIGCVAFQMATASPPWKDKGFTNPISLFNHIKNHKGPPPMDIPREELSSNSEKRAGQLFDELLKKCFEKEPSKRPTVVELQQDPFFIEMYDGEDDEASHDYRSLFSPGNETTASRDSIRSPVMLPRASDALSPQRLPSPSPQLGRSKSVVQWKTSFLSPPRPKRNTERASPSPMRASPQTISSNPDTTEWPQWARVQLRNQKLSNQSPGRRKKEQDVSDLMGSLALSEDSGTSGPNPFGTGSQGRTSTIGSADRSNLFGLHFLDQSASTYEL